MGRVERLSWIRSLQPQCFVWGLWVLCGSGIENLRMQGFRVRESSCSLLACLGALGSSLRDLDGSLLQSLGLADVVGRAGRLLHLCDDAARVGE